MAYRKIKEYKGNKYVYELTSYRCKETKKIKRREIYLGICVDEATKEYAAKKSKVVSLESSINKRVVNYGDSFLLDSCLKNSNLFELVNNLLPKESDIVKATLFYKIIDGSAFTHYNSWFSSNYVNVLFPNANCSSQRISEILNKLGNEMVQRAFFKAFIANVANISNDVVIDSTGLDNEIDIPLTAYSGKESITETRLILVLDTATKMPLYFRLVAGNINDVSTLGTTLKLAGQFGLNPTMVLLDAGYYSFKNIRFLYQSKIDFLTRLPKSRKLYNELIGKTNYTLEKSKNTIIYNKRSLYIEMQKVDLDGYVGYAYVCKDIKEAGKKQDKFLRQAKEDKLTDDEIDKELSCIGKFILVSNKNLDVSEILPLYYTRQTAENAFGKLKSNLDLLPLRVHSIQSLKGYTFLCYIALLLTIEIQNKLQNLCSLEESLKIAKGQFAEIFDNEIITTEPNRRLKEIYERLGIVGGINLGI